MAHVRGWGRQAIRRRMGSTEVGPSTTRSASRPAQLPGETGSGVIDAARLGSDLPIVGLLPAIHDTLATGTRLVLSAPPGAGKTTIVPLALANAPWAADKRIVMLEPRRLATRAAAQRMAALLGEAVGETVGYQTRDERRIGRTTRIEVVTEGILTRRLHRDPELPDVAAVIFDEVHERNLTTDLGLALALDAAATIRPDLRIVAMSATADLAAFARLLVMPSGDDGTGSPAPVLHTEGRSYPIDVRWRPVTAAPGVPGPARRRGGGHPPRRDDSDAALAAVIAEALRDEPGDVLVFLPGIGEIMRLRDRLLATLPDHVDVRPLAGALGIEEQDLALRPSPVGRRRVVLATDIAETSLTVEGVRVVVDSGQARAPKLDIGTGMTRLVTGSISRDSADQRAGRAGRTEPGVAYRMWSKLEHGTRPARRTAEILDVELSGLALELAAWGTSPDELRFIDPPPPRPWQQARTLLASLGALDDGTPVDTSAAGGSDGGTRASSGSAGGSTRATSGERAGNGRLGHPGRLTDDGRRMLALPLHPRLAKVVAAAPTAGACVVAALLDDRDIMRGRPSELPTDLAIRARAVAGLAGDDRLDRQAVRRAEQRAKDIARRAGIDFRVDQIAPDHLGALLLAGFPDRLAGRRRRGQFQLRSGAAVVVADDDPLADATFIVAADLDGNRSGARVRLAAAVDAFEIAAILDDVVEHRRLTWDSVRDDLVETVERRLDALVIDQSTGPATPSTETTAALIDRLRSQRLAGLSWTAAARNLQARVAFVRATAVAAGADAGHAPGGLTTTANADADADTGGAADKFAGGRRAPSHRETSSSRRVGHADERSRGSTGAEEAGAEHELLTGDDTAAGAEEELGTLETTGGYRWPDLSDGTLARSADEWLAPLLVGATRRADVERLDVLTALRTLLPWPLPAELDRLAPTTWTTPNGTTLAIDYADARPTIAVRVQDVFGVTEQPTVGPARTPITFELRSPADRPIQTTADLPGFWTGSWRDVRKEMAGRYPKHRWPENPAIEQPGRLKHPRR